MRTRKNLEAGSDESKCKRNMGLWFLFYQGLRHLQSMRKYSELFYQSGINQE